MALTFTGTKQQGELAAIIAKANSLNLTVSEGSPAVLTGSFGAYDSVRGALASFYTLARLRLDTGLYPLSAFCAAQVDQWIAFFNTELAAPLKAQAAEAKTALAVLDARLQNSTFLAGDKLTLADLYAWNGLRSTAVTGNVKRWFNTIQNSTAVQAVLNPSDVTASASASAAKPAAAAAAAAEDSGSESSDFDLEGSDDEDTKAFIAKKNAETAAATQAVIDRQKKKAEAGSAKSDIAFDIKTLESSENEEENKIAMEDLLKKVRSVELDGLKWMGYQFVPVGYGILKLRIMCQIIDIKVPGGPDEVVEAISNQPWFEDLVQSVDVFSFQMAA